MRWNLDSLRWVAAALVTWAAWLGLASAQTSESAAGAMADPLLRCGTVDVRSGDIHAYFGDLCVAFTSALGEASLHMRMGSAAHVQELLVDGGIDIAFGLPWERTGAAPVRHGPIVLISPLGRFGIAAREGNDRLLETVSWLFHALVEAEALGIDRAAVDDDLATVPEASAEAFRRYERRLTEQLGLDGGALRRMLAWAGHHGEIYDRWFDQGAAVNRPVELGGQLYAPPVGGP